MTEYTPEKVAELTGKAQRFRDTLAEIDQAQDMSDGSIISLWLHTADALTAVSAERDAAREAAEDHVLDAEATYGRLMPKLKKAEADRDRLHKAITEALEIRRTSNLSSAEMVYAIFRALTVALDKEGDDDE